MYTFIFQIQKLEKKLVVAEKELQRARKNNQTLARYINAKRKKEDARKKEEKEAHKKVEEGQSSKDVQTSSKGGSRPQSHSVKDIS
jgi:hypothetical protein